jgi:hypothetical protein
MLLLPLPPWELQTGLKLEGSRVILDAISNENISYLPLPAIQPTTSLLTELTHTVFITY